MSQAHSIAADYDDRFIYWAEKSNDNAGIYKSTFLLASKWLRI